MMIIRTEEEDASKGTRLIYPKTVKSLVKIKKQAKYGPKTMSFYSIPGGGSLHLISRSRQLLRPIC